MLRKPPKSPLWYGSGVAASEAPGRAASATVSATTVNRKILLADETSISSPLAAPW
jgi:hypothetical protein